LRLVSSSWQRDQNNPLYQYKSVNYLEAILARRLASSNGFDDVLFFNMKGHATETTCANFFIIKKEQIMTPKLEDGLLPGITRTRLLQYAREHGILVIERSLGKADIDGAEVVFLTNSLQGIQLVSSLDDQSFSLAHPLLDKIHPWLCVS
jgi:4-amino-4-deoxychorismate lyase